MSPKAKGSTWENGEESIWRNKERDLPRLLSWGNGSDFTYERSVKNNITKPKL